MSTHTGDSDYKHLAALFEQMAATPTDDERRERLRT